MNIVYTFGDINPYSRLSAGGEWLVHYREHSDCVIKLSADGGSNFFAGNHISAPALTEINMKYLRLSNAKIKHLMLSEDPRA